MMILKRVFLFLLVLAIPTHANAVVLKFFNNYSYGEIVSDDDNFYFLDFADNDGDEITKSELNSLNINDAILTIQFDDDTTVDQEEYPGTNSDFFTTTDLHLIDENPDGPLFRYLENVFKYMYSPDEIVDIRPFGSDTAEWTVYGEYYEWDWNTVTNYTKTVDNTACTKVGIEEYTDPYSGNTESRLVCTEGYGIQIWSREWWYQYGYRIFGFKSFRIPDELIEGMLLRNNWWMDLDVYGGDDTTIIKEISVSLYTDNDRYGSALSLTNPNNIGDLSPISNPNIPEVIDSTVPEPATFSILLLGSSVLFLSRRKSKLRSEKTIKL